MDINKNLHKKHKYNTKSGWKRLGIKITEEEFEFIYGVYLNTFECQLNIHPSCSKTFKSNYDRQLDHDHKTGEIRAICCNNCNQISDRQISKNNTSGHRHISTMIDNGVEYYVIQFRFDKKDIRRRRAKHLHSIESVIELRDSLHEKYNLKY